MQATSPPFVAPHIQRSSGRRQYKNWRYDQNGARAGAVFTKNSNAKKADLIRTTYMNPNKKEVLYLIPFDIDIKNETTQTHSKWLDFEGKIDHMRMMNYLLQEYPKIARMITYIARSSGGKGLGMAIAISPLPLDLETTKKAESKFSMLQGRLVQFFRSLGFGADTGALGLARDMPNFNNPDKLLYYNEISHRHVINSRYTKRSILKECFEPLNEWYKVNRKKTLLYNDARVESRLSILFMLLLGELSGSYKQKANEMDLSCPFSYSGEEVQITVKKLIELTNLKEQFVRNILNNPPVWMKADYISYSEGWRLSMPIYQMEADHLSCLVERSNSLFSCISSSGYVPQRFSNIDPRQIERPENVLDGARNAWLVRVALAYKFRGIPMSAALDLIARRIIFIPGYESSRNCKEYKRIVKSIYKKLTENFGVLADKSLPAWMSDNSIFRAPRKPKSSPILLTLPVLFLLPDVVNNESSLNPRRGGTPGLAPLGDDALVLLGGSLCSFLMTLTKVAKFESTESENRIKQQPILNSFDFTACVMISVERITTLYGGEDLGKIPPNGIRLSGGKDSGEIPPQVILDLFQGNKVLSSVEEVKLVAIWNRQLVGQKHRNVVGIFYDDRLLFCVNEYHYKQKNVLDYLNKDKHNKYGLKGKKITIYTPKIKKKCEKREGYNKSEYENRHKKYYQAMYDAPDEMILSSQIGSRRENAKSKVDDWAEKNSVENIILLPTGRVFKYKEKLSDKKELLSINPDEFKKPDEIPF